MKPTLALLAALLAVPAAASKISILPFAGPGGANTRNQVAAALCDSADCVPNAKVGGAKPDWKKARKEGVGFIVTGKIAKVKRKEILELSVLAAGGRAVLKKHYTLGKGGRLSDGALNEVRDAVGASAPTAPTPPIEKAEPPPPPPEKREEPVAAKPPEKDPYAELSSAAKTEDTETAPPKTEETSSTRKSSFKRSGKNPIVAADVGLDLFSRTFSYTNVQTNNLRSYKAGLIFAPHLKLEAYPAAAFSNGILSGIGLEGGYLTAVGLKSKRAEGPSYPTSVTRLDLALRFNWKPVGGSDAYVTPLIGYRIASFSVGAASDGTTLDGLPGIRYTSLVLGLGGEVPLMEDSLFIFGRFVYLPVSSSGEIISDAYFKSGKASGFEGNLGAGYQVMPHVQVRVTGLFVRYGLTFQTDPGDTYVADSASEQQLGANLAVRLTY